MQQAVSAAILLISTICTTGTSALELEICKCSFGSTMRPYRRILLLLVAAIMVTASKPKPPAAERSACCPPGSRLPPVSSQCAPSERCQGAPCCSR